nr:MAG TPA: hypothetical protein [Bacteriophage sp.]
MQERSRKKIRLWLIILLGPIFITLLVMLQMIMELT